MQNMEQTTTEQNDSKITLFYNNVITNDPCCLCGRRTDPCGFDYGINNSLVCDMCAQERRPDLVEIRKDVFAFSKSEGSAQVFSLCDAIKSELAKTLEDRILGVISLHQHSDCIPF